MKISTVYLARYLADNRNAVVTFNFGKLIEVTVEVKSYRKQTRTSDVRVWWWRLLCGGNIHG